jgi:hypothetical protein
VFGTVLPGEAPGPDVFAVDLLDRAAVAAMVEQVRPDVVVHLAAIAFVAHGDAEQIYRVNVVGTRNLLEALARRPHKPSAVLLASSANIYGNADVAVIDEDVPAGAGQRLRGQQAGHGIHGAPVDGQAADHRSRVRSTTPAWARRELPAAEDRVALPPQARAASNWATWRSRATFPTCAWSPPATAACWRPARPATPSMSAPATPIRWKG